MDNLLGTQGQTQEPEAVAPVEQPEAVAPEAVAPSVEQQVTEQVQAETSLPSLQELVGEDLWGQGNIKDFKDVPSLAKSNVELQKLVGNSLRIPPEDASPEAKQDFYDKLANVPGLVQLTEDNAKIYEALGVPKEATDYLAEGIDEGILSRVQDTAHKLNMTPEQLQGVVELKNALDQEQLDKVYVDPEQASQELDKLWGADYDNRLAGAKLAAEYCKKNHPGDFDNILTGPLENNVMLLDLLSRVGGTLAESESPIAQQAIKYGVTPEEAAAKIKEKMADRGFMDIYTDAMAVGHAEAVATMTKLNQLKVGR